LIGHVVESSQVDVSLVVDVINVASQLFHYACKKT